MDFDYVGVAEHFHALGSKTRICILTMLTDYHSLNVSEMIDKLPDYLGKPLRQGTASRHLGILSRKGIVIRERDGRHAIYRLNKDAFHGSAADFYASLAEETDTNLRLPFYEGTD